MTKDEAIVKAKKLKALADRGIDGEKIVAGDKLKELMKKYSLTMADITDTAPKYVFPGPGGGAGSGHKPGDSNIWSHGPTKYFMKVNTSDAEFNVLVSKIFMHTQNQEETKKMILEFERCGLFKKRIYKTLLRERLKQLESETAFAHDIYEWLNEMFGK